MGPGPPINISFTLKTNGVGRMVGSLQGLCWISQEHETGWVKSQYGRQLLQMTLWAGGSSREQQGPQQYLLPADAAKKLFLLFISLKQFSVSEVHTTTSLNPKFVKMCNPGSEDHWNCCRPATWKKDVTHSFKMGCKIYFGLIFIDCNVKHMTSTVFFTLVLCMCFSELGQCVLFI